MSSIDVISNTTTARWFVQRRGIMTGIMKVGTGAGQLVMPLVASALIASSGWRTSYIVVGATVMVLLISIGTEEGLKQYFAKVHDYECTERLKFAVEKALEILQK